MRGPSDRGVGACGQRACGGWGGCAEGVGGGGGGVGGAERSGGEPDGRALLVVAQMSAANNLLDSRYTRACVDMARRHRAFVMGFIAMEPLNEMPDDDFVVMTPGCALPREESLDGSEWAGASEVDAEGL